MYTVVREPSLKKSPFSGCCAHGDYRKVLLAHSVGITILISIVHVGIVAFGRILQYSTTLFASRNGGTRLSRFISHDSTSILASNWYESYVTRTLLGFSWRHRDFASCKMTTWALTAHVRRFEITLRASSSTWTGSTFIF